MVLDPSLNIIGGVAFEILVSGALLGKLQGCAHSVHIVNSSVQASMLEIFAFQRQILTCPPN